MYLRGDFRLKRNHTPKYFTFDWLLGNAQLSFLLTCGNKLPSTPPHPSDGLGS